MEDQNGRPMEDDHFLDFLEDHGRPWKTMEWKTKTEILWSFGHQRLGTTNPSGHRSHTSMTFIYFVACAATAIMPITSLYHASNLVMHGGWSCVSRTCAVFVMTNLLKMLLLSTVCMHALAEDVEDHIGDPVTFWHEVLEAVNNLSVLIGMFYCFKCENVSKLQTSVRTPSVVLAIGIGWAWTDAVTRRLLPLWYGTRSPDFSWQHLQVAFQSTIRLIECIASSALVWCAFVSASATARSLAFPLLGGICAQSMLKAAVMIMVTGGTEFGWSYLAVELAFALALAGAADIAFKNGRSDALERRVSRGRAVHATTVSRKKRNQTKGRR